MSIVPQVLVVLVLFTVQGVFAEGPEFKTIDADQLKKKIDVKKKMALVDARTAEEYRDGHIPKAINIPPEMVNDSAKLLPKDKSMPVIIYCRGAT